MKIKVRSRNRPPRGMVSATINVTYRCNWSCRHCLQLCDVWKQPCSDVTPEQVDQFVEQAAALPLYFVRISGGEPTLHPEFEAILDYVDEKLVRNGPARYGGVDTNTPDGTIKLPPHWTQISFPNKARHNAHLISPHELGIRSEDCGKFCRIQNRCGLGFDFRGWSFCLIAPNLEGILGIERQPAAGPVLELDAETCKHCVWSLSRRQMGKINQDVAEGKIKWPSEVFKPGLEMLGDREVIERTARSIEVKLSR